MKSARLESILFLRNSLICLLSTTPLGLTAVCMTHVGLGQGPAPEVMGRVRCPHSTAPGTFPRTWHLPCPSHGYVSKLNHQETGGFSPCLQFHLPGFDSGLLAPSVLRVKRLRFRCLGHTRCPCCCGSGAQGPLGGASFLFVSLGSKRRTEVHCVGIPGEKKRATWLNSVLNNLGVWLSRIT